MNGIERGASAIAAGELIVYPTETVYGLGGDATDVAAIDAVFALKERDRLNPLSVAVPSISAIDHVARMSPRTRSFVEAFLPGPVTVVCERREELPEQLTGGLERVGVRIPDHPLALELLEQTPPLTATSANPSGGASPQSPDELDPRIRAGVGAIVDGGRTPGTPSSVVDVDREKVHRRGAGIDRIEAWLESH